MHTGGVTEYHKQGIKVQRLDELLEISNTTIAIIGGAIGMAVAIMRLHNWYWEKKRQQWVNETTLEEFQEMKSKIETVIKEVKPNSGESLKDAVHRVENKVDRISEEKADADKVERKLSQKADR